MELFSERTSLIDTENAFKVGPYIGQVEAERGRDALKPVHDPGVVRLEP